MNTIKVLHIVATGRLSGAEKVVSDICTNLNKNFSPMVVCAGEELQQYYLKKGIPSKIIDVNGLRSSSIKALKELMEKEGINIVHGHDVKASIAGYRAAKKLNIPVISHIHVTYLWLQKFGPLPIIDKYYRRKYNLSIACSSMVHDYYLEHNSSVKPDKIVALENAFNFKEFKNTAITESEEFKKSIGIANKGLIYGYLGRLLAVKGADLMIRAFKEVCNSYEDVFLLIVGDGEEREALEKLAAELKINDKIMFVGYQNRVYDYMNCFDCFILPSIREGLPIAVLEAMAMKKPVISTPVAGLKNLMKNEFNGLVLGERSEKELVAAMKKLYNDKKLAHDIGENAYKYLYENYNLEEYIKKLQLLYYDVLSSKR